MSTVRFRVEAEGPAPVATSYAYLADPRTRPEWQSSLRRIEDLQGDGEVGTSWVDVTTAGVRPRLEVTELVPDLVWAEVGRWRRVSADLRMLFSPLGEDGSGGDGGEGGGTRVVADVRLELPGPLAPVAWALRLAGPAAVRADLRAALREAARQA